MPVGTFAAEHGHRELCEPLPVRQEQRQEDLPDWRETPCWPWPHVGNHGYALFPGTQLGHWAMYRLYWGPIPPGYEVEHRCAVRACVNPLHLRLLTRAENSQHRTRPNVTNTSGFRGVSYCKQTGRWAAQITLDGKTHWLGRHPTPEAARDVVARFMAERAPHSEYGDGGFHDA